MVARQRPGTAGGVVFVLLEDEFGVINLVVPPQVYERHRLAVRTEPLLLVEGRLERHAQQAAAINVLVKRVAPSDAPGGLVAQVQDFSLPTSGCVLRSGRSPPRRERQQVGRERQQVGRERQPVGRERRPGRTVTWTTSAPWRHR